jgi:hypothetical protein
MKKIGTIAVLLLILLITASGCHNSRRQKKELKEYAAMHSMRDGQGAWHGKGMWNMRGRFADGMRGGMMNNMRPGMGRGMRQGMGPQMRMGRAMWPMHGDSTAMMPLGPGRRMLESIPNVTEDQKKQIGQLMQKNREEVKKITEEFASKMKSTRESNRKEMLDLLTPEQKKYFESGQKKPF